jgi:hypothetical protein
VVSFIGGGNRSLSHILLYRVHPTWVIFELTTLVVIGSNCICSCKSNYHKIMTPTAPRYLYCIVLILVYNFRIVTRGFYSEKDAAAAVKQTLIAVQVNITVDRFVYIYIFKMFKCHRFLLLPLLWSI